MNLQDFINRLALTRPPKALFLKENQLSEEDYSMILKEFIIPKRNAPQILIEKATGIIGEIISHYEAFNIHFGDYGFLNKIIQWNDIYLFASSSDLFLGFENTQSAIIEIDINEECYEISTVAADINALLETIIFLSQIKSNQYCRLFDEKDKEKIAKKCSKLSGGEMSFYERMV